MKDQDLAFARPQADVLGDGRAHCPAISAHEFRGFVSLPDPQVKSGDLRGIDDLVTRRLCPDGQVGFLASAKR